MERRTRVSKEDGMLSEKDYYRGWTPQQKALLMVSDPDGTRAALVWLARNKPTDAYGIIPDAFDGMTGLYSKEWFETEELPHSLEESVKKGVPLTLTRYDFDDFKGINDFHGHDIGDHVIREFANTLKTSFRGVEDERRKRRNHYGEEQRKKDRRSTEFKDSFARFSEKPSYEQNGRVGGDEFASILYGCPEEVAYDRLVKFLKEVNDQTLKYNGAIVENKGVPLQIRLSIGIAGYHPELPFMGTTEKEKKEFFQSEAVQLMKNADEAHYDAKKGGKNAVAVYSPQIKVASKS